VRNTASPRDGIHLHLHLCMPTLHCSMSLSGCFAGRAARTTNPPHRLFLHNHYSSLWLTTPLMLAQAPALATKNRSCLLNSPSTWWIYQHRLFANDSTPTIKRVSLWPFCLFPARPACVENRWLCCRLQSCPYNFGTSCPILACVCEVILLPRNACIHLSFQPHARVGSRLYTVDVGSPRRAR